MADNLGDQGPQLEAPQRAGGDFVESLFSPVTKGPVDQTKPNIVDPIVRKGSLISFNYMFMKHDPYPMVIVTDIQYGSRVRGVNLNYLTFRDITRMLHQFGENPSFSYTNLKYDRSLLAAIESFREYKWMGIRQLRKLNSDFLLQTIEVARSYDPSQMNEMRKAVKEQLQQQVNAKAGEIEEPETLYTQQPTGTVGTIPTVPTQPASQPAIGGEGNQ